MASRPPHGNTPVGTAGERLGERYQLVRPLARGGMAEVWEATDTILGRSVAAKILYPHLAVDAGFRARFKREAISAARLNHPAIVTVYDTGIDEPVGQSADAVRAYIIMEMVPGRTMRALMSEGALSVADAVSIVAQAADGLAYAHASGFVHRDVKPGNIMVQPDGRVKVADFGIAKALQQQITGNDEDLTQAGSILGTAKYLSPEQVEGTDVDARSDIYSLGVVLYEAACGRPPFVGSTDLATATLHVSGTTQRPRQVRPEITRSLEQVIMTAMARSPMQRYQKASDLARALRTLPLDDDAVPAISRGPAAHTPARGIPPERPANSPSTTQSPAPGASNPSHPTGSTKPVTADGDAATVLMDERTRVAPRQGTSARPTTRPPIPPPRGEVTAEHRGAARPGERSRSGAGRGLVSRLVPIVLVGLLLGGVGGWVWAAPHHRVIAIQTVRTFDPPPGDGSERDELLGNLTDDTLAAWRTETYDNGFAALSKRGVGVIVDLGSVQRVDSLQVASLSAGWSAVVYVADTPKDNLAGWTRVARVEPVPANTLTMRVRHDARYVLLWIDDLGPNASVSIAELKVLS